MKLLILGNGFEINFNPKLLDFNKKFREWIISHYNSDKIYDLCDQIAKVQNKYSKPDTLNLGNLMGSIN